QRRNASRPRSRSSRWVPRGIPARCAKCRLLRLRGCPPLVLPPGAAAPGTRTRGRDIQGPRGPVPARERPRSFLTTRQVVGCDRENGACLVGRHVVEGMSGALGDPASVERLELDPTPGFGELDVDVALLEEHDLVAAVHELRAALAPEEVDLADRH